MRLILVTLLLSACATSPDTEGTGTATPPADNFAKVGAQLIALIKPQFEAGREEVGKGGVVRDPDVHTRVCNEIKMWLVEKNWTVHGLTTSPITGPQGNVEFLVWAQKSVAPIVELQHLA